MNKFDVLIIGSGPGGYRTAEYAVRKGLQVAVFENISQCFTALFPHRIQQTFELTDTGI